MAHTAGEGTSEGGPVDVKGCGQVLMLEGQTLGRGRVEWSEESVLTTLDSSTANSTLAPELQEAEEFIMDNKKCDQIYRKKSHIPRVVPLVLGDMICATNYREDLCSVSFWEVLAALLRLG